MFNLSNVRAQSAIIHHVGNRHRAQENKYSTQIFQPGEVMEEALIRYLSKPVFKEKQMRRFVHSQDINLNEVYSYCERIFRSPGEHEFVQATTDMARHLYNQSNHPNIRTGDLCVMHLTDVLWEDELVEAVGIFKIERNESFLRINTKIKTEGEGAVLLPELLIGVPLDRIDKGCLVINTEASDGYRLIAVDDNNYDALYWKHHFLGADVLEDEYFFTTQLFDAVVDFSDVVSEHFGIAERINFINKAANYIGDAEVVSLVEMGKHLFEGNGELETEFADLIEDYSIEDAFEVNKDAFKARKGKLRRNIRTDTGFELKFSSDDRGEHFVDRGYDDEKGMYYYKVFFNSEQ